MKEALNFGLDPENNFRVIRVDETGMMRVGSTTTSGGFARTTNPTAVADAAHVDQSFDKLGRALVVPYQVRELVSTARVILTGGTGGNTETTLLAGIAGTFLDLVQLTGLTATTAAFGVAASSVQIDIRDATGGGIVHSLIIPNEDSIPLTFSPPLPQNTAAAAWTVQTPSDISAGTNITISATFVKNT